MSLIRNSKLLYKNLMVRKFRTSAAVWDETSSKSDDEQEFLQRLKTILYGESGASTKPSKDEQGLDDTEVEHDDEPKS